MKAVIMAGGEGSRLRPLTCTKPKPLVSIMGKPAMEHIINLLKKHGITEIAVTLQYLPQEIIDYFGDGEGFDVSLKYYIETSPLGTAGSVKNAEDFLDEDFLIISGDALTDIDLTRAIRFHKEKRALATLVLYRMPQPLEYGVVITDESGRIERFIEKPDWSEVFSDTVNTGIYILNPMVLNKFGKNEMYDFGKDLFPQMLSDGEPMFGHVADGYWCDIGDIDAYISCHRDILDKKVWLDPSVMCEITGYNGVYTTDADISLNDVSITPPVFIGKGAKLMPNAAIGPYSIIGENCTLRPDVTIKRGILWENVSVANRAQIRGAVVCDRVVAGEGVQIYENTIVGSKTRIGENASIAPDIKIWPQKDIAEGTHVDANLVWGSHVHKRVFDQCAICGEINIDITPEYATKIGGAFGAMLKNGKIAVSHTGTNSTEMLASALMAGLLSSGAEVYSYGEQTLPITRSAIRFYALDGGVHIGVTQKEGETRLLISFMEKGGINLSRNSERKLETLFVREDFVRSEPKDIKNVMKLDNFKYYYLREIINNLKNKKLDISICIKTNSEIIANLMGLIARDLSMTITDDLAKCDFAIELDGDGEDLVLYDRGGNKISRDKYLLLTAILLLNVKRGAKVVMPISAPQASEQVAKAYGGSVVWSKFSKSEFIKSISEEGETVQLKLLFDGIYAAVKLADYLKTNNTTLEECMKNIPQFYKKETEVDCKDEYKGKIIRELIDQYKSDKMELTEGVKIYRNGGWVLVVPHATKRACRIITEGYNEEYANELTDVFSKYIEKSQR